MLENVKILSPHSYIIFSLQIKLKTQDRLKSSTLIVWQCFFFYYLEQFLLIDLFISSISIRLLSFSFYLTLRKQRFSFLLKSVVSNLFLISFYSGLSFRSLLLLTAVYSEVFLCCQGRTHLWKWSTCPYALNCCFFQIDYFLLRREYYSCQKTIRKGLFRFSSLSSCGVGVSYRINAIYASYQFVQIIRWYFLIHVTAERSRGNYFD